jgi:hypothetical protein
MAAPKKEATKLRLAWEGFRASTEDRDIISNRKKRAGITRSAYLRHMAVHGVFNIYEADESLRQLITQLAALELELARQGNNINQYAYRANAIDRFNHPAFEAALIENKTTREQIENLMMKAMEMLTHGTYQHPKPGGL